MRKNLKEKQGITLIALVITIIVLLILAGVSIAMLTGQNGILTQANNAKIEQSHGAVREAISLAYNEWQIELNTASNVKVASTEVVTIKGEEEKALATNTTFLQFLESKGYIKEGTPDVLDVEALTGSKQSLGNGTGTDDVYKIEGDDSNYKVVYYENATTTTEISTIAKMEGEENPFSYTQADIDKTLEYLNYDEETGVINGVSSDYYKGMSGNIDIPIEKVVIPSEINGNKVTIYIGEQAGFTQSHTNSCFGTVKTVIFLNENEMTGFGGCEALENVKLPSKLGVLESYVFRGCSSLVNVEIPDTLETIGDRAFDDCISLEELIIPSSVTSIGWEAFANCPNLTITVEEGSSLTTEDFTNAGIENVESQVIFE